MSDEPKISLPKIVARSAGQGVSTGRSPLSLIEQARKQSASSKTAERILGRAAGRFAIALDATGSMSGLIEDAKRSIGTIISRINAEAGVGTELQLYVYRDYDCGTKVLERSPRSMEVGPLLQWLRSIEVAGGGGNGGEAVEAALADILAANGFDAVMIAGDEGSNSAANIRKAGIKSLTAIEIARALGARNIPVHTFVVGDDKPTIQNFRAIAAASGGQSGCLDGSSEMIDMAVLAMLASIKGSAAVREYGIRYKLSANASAFASLLIAGPN